MTPDRQQFDALDVISVLSFFLGYKNLMENREQSAHNDVSAANDKQAQFILEELGRQFEEQNQMLREILEGLKRGRQDQSEYRGAVGVP